MDWLVWLADNAARVAVALIIAAANFLAAAGAGAATAVVVAWLERRWHRKEVRAAEKRVRQEERFESIRIYAMALQEFVHEAAGLMRVSNRSWRDEGWGSPLATLERELTERWDNADGLRPRPGPAYILRDEAALEPLIVLQLEANICRLKGLEALAVGGAMTDDMANGFVQGADDALDKLLTRMDELVAQVQA